MAIGILINTLIIGTMSYISGRNSLQDAYFAQLTSVREIKKRDLESYFRQIRSQVLTFSENRMVVDAMSSLKDAFHATEITGQSTHDAAMNDYFQQEFMPRINNQGSISGYKSTDQRTLLFQNMYISGNTAPVGSKDNMTRASSNNRYNELHEFYHPVIRNYLKEFSYYDIFLVDPETGHIIYSVFKEVDYGTSLINGPFSNSNLADVFNQARNANSSDFVAISTYDQYAPSYNAPAAFVASPVFNNGVLEGVLVFQMPLDEINAVMTGNEGWVNDGLGTSGESYILGEDKTMRSVSRFMLEDEAGYFQALADAGYSQSVIDNIKTSGTSILFQEVDTEGARLALQGQSNTQIIQDYRDVNVLSAYAPLDIEGLNWVMLVEIDEAEAFAPIYTLRNTILIVGLIVLAIAIVIAVAVARSMAAPIVLLSSQLGKIADGDLTIKVEANSNDEVGTAMNSLKLMIDKLREVIGGIITSSDQITTASTEMNQSSQQMSEGSTEQASSAEEVSSSMEEMAANIQQNTDNSRETERIAKKAAEDIQESNQAVEETVSSMQTIAEKISIIGEISRQTNLLALNAAVEAARAGEHGKGFAVVAAEVRKLAERSQQAASEIDHVSKSSVAVAQKSGKMLTDIVPDIRKTSDLIQEITAANIEMSSGSDQVNSAIQQLNQVVQQNAANAEEIAATSEELNSQALSMKDMISYFRIDSGSTSSTSRTRRPAPTYETIKEHKAPAAQISAPKKSGGLSIDLGGEDKHDSEYEKF